MLLFATALAIIVCSTRAEDGEQEESNRAEKLLPIFQVVRFPNDICSGTSRNGTCYTAEECSSKGGTNDGTCASGFGVCCIFALSCGGSSSENQTYLVQASTTSLTSPCLFTICKCSTNICRIRFDFTTFVLASAVAGTSEAAAGTAASSQIGSAMGDCLTDAFTLSGESGAPTICGSNGGYHMIVDASDSCHVASFNIGALTTTTRKWDIRVTQYACGDFDMSGPPGCLQYHTGTAGTIANFGFPTTATTVTAAVTHLSNQDYDVCIRRASGYCLICYTPTIIGGATAAAQTSFGLSLSSETTAESAADTECYTDYLEIPYGQTATIAAITTPGTVVSNHRVCGRIFNTASTITTTLTICSRRTPFTLGVNFDSNEVTGTNIADAKDNVRESSGIPGGIVGFKLTYYQVAC